VTAARLRDDDPQADWTTPGAYLCAPGVHRIPLPLPNDGLRAVNVYAIADNDGLTLVDSGWALEQSEELLVESLAAIGAGLGDVRRFLVTHAHRDHYTQAVALRRRFGATVALGAGEKAGLDEINRPDRGSGGASHIERLIAAGAPDLAAEVSTTMRAPMDLAVWEDPDEWLDDGAVITVGGAGAQGRTLTAIATPGHTRGHLVFADPEHDLMFTGDHVLPTITPSIGFEPVSPTSPLSDFLTSLRLLRAGPDAAMLPAHGVVGRRVHERVDELLAHHGHRLDATLAAVAQGCATPAEVAAVLTWTRRERTLSELDPFNRMLATLETAVHLQVLVERSAVAVELVGGVTHYTVT
jgi:glyoxylase-like metal-dependent hydrolase (beta-lactamase superfamily II)